MGCCGGCGGGKPDPTGDKEKEQEKPASKVKFQSPQVITQKKKRPMSHWPFFLL